MRSEHGFENPVDDFAAGIERSEDDLAIARGEFERRSQSGDVPTRIAPRKFVTGRKIDAALRVEFTQQFFQAALVRDLGMRSLDGNAGGRNVNFGTHKGPAGGTY